MLVVPNTKRQHHPIPQSRFHPRYPTLGVEAIDIPDRSLLARAELLRYGVVRGHAGDIDFRVLDDITVLNVNTADLSEVSVGRVIRGEELGDDGHLLRGVNYEPGTEEGCIAHTVGVEIAAVGIAGAVVAVSGGVTLRTTAAVLTLDSTRMSGVGSGNAVSFPDIHFVAAGSVVACSTVGISCGRNPAFYVSLKYEAK